MTRVASPLRQASAVFLTSDGGRDVWLVRRDPRLRFFGGYDAAPGGTLDPVDGDPDEPGDAAFRRAALRELFEELGVLPPELARAWAEGERRDLRDGLLQGDDAAALRFREALDARPEVLARLEPLGFLTTPPFAPVRYRTLFLGLELPADQTPEVCGAELVACARRPAAAWLEAWDRGEERIVPPVLWLLDLLREVGPARFPELARARCAEHEAGRLTRIRNSPGIWMAALRTPTLPPATTTNTYVVGERELFVVDPATYEASEQARLFDLLDELGAEGRRVAGVLVTHHHHDHVGAVQAVAERHGVPVFAHPLTLERLPAPPRDARPVLDGDRLELGDAPDGSPGWHLVAYHTPGHDRGHLVWRDSRYGSLLAGDLCSTVSTIVIEPPEGHLATYLHSLRRMEAVPLGLLHPAHGPVARDGRALLRRYLEHRARREELLRAELGRRAPATVEELVPGVYTDVPEAVFPMAARSLLAGLEKLEEDGLARRADGRWSPLDGATA